MADGPLSPETLKLLGQYDADPTAAIDAVPDADLQRVSPRYAQARSSADEATVKALMKDEIGGASPAGNAPAVMRPPSDRELFLQRLVDFATVPVARSIIERELERERTTQEITILVAAAERAGDDSLAEELSAILHGAGPEDDELYDEDDGLTEDQSQWLAAADEQARAYSPDETTEEPTNAQIPGLAGGSGTGAGDDEVSGAPAPDGAVPPGEPEPPRPADTAAPAAGMEQPAPVGDGVAEPAPELIPTGKAKGSGGTMADQLGELFTKPVKPIGRIKIRRKAVEEETGQQFEMTERADVALRDVDKQIATLRSLLECLQS